MRAENAKSVRKLFVFVFSLVIVVLVLERVQAGSLNPSSNPAGTMKTLSEIYNPLASGSFDSSAMASSSNGSAIQIGRCILYRLNGGSC